MDDIALRKAVVSDEDGLWLMLFYASHSHDDGDAVPDDVRLNPDLQRYVAGWGRAGDVGVVAESGDDICGAAWLRLFAENDRLDVLMQTTGHPNSPWQFSPAWRRAAQEHRC